MIKLIQLIGAISLLISSNGVAAGTIIQIQNNNDLTTVSTDGKLARMSMSGDEYVIVDYSNKTVKVVSPEKQQVMLLDANKMPAGKHGAEVRTLIKKLGAGIEIAGYPTEKYAYSANGKSCGVIYGSKDVYQQAGIKELFELMKIMMEKQRAVLGGLASMLDDCTLADMNISDHVTVIGVPMRTDRNGHIETEIKSIKSGVALPANSFVIPASYKVVSVDDQINSAKKDMANIQQQMQRYQPQMQQMMQQMQQSGQMTPEMQQQMRQAEEMMRQYQQR